MCVCVCPRQKFLLGGGRCGQDCPALHWGPRTSSGERRDRAGAKPSNTKGTGPRIPQTVSMKRSFSLSELHESLDDGIVPSTMRRVKYVPTSCPTASCGAASSGDSRGAWRHVSALLPPGAGSSLQPPLLLWPGACARGAAARSIQHGRHSRLHSRLHVHSLVDL